MSMRHFLALAVLALCFLAGPNFVYSQEFTVDVNELTPELQRTSNVNNHITLVWWIPDEFWQASLKSGGSVSAGKGWKASSSLSVTMPS